MVDDPAPSGSSAGASPPATPPASQELDAGTPDTSLSRTPKASDDNKTAAAQPAAPPPTPLGPAPLQLGGPCLRSRSDSHAFRAEPADAVSPPGPPQVQGVPLPQIVARLHRLAPYFWTRPETSDLVVLVPLSGAIAPGGVPTTPLRRSPLPARGAAAPRRPSAVSPQKTPWIDQPGQSSRLFGRRRRGMAADGEPAASDAARRASDAMSDLSTEPGSPQLPSSASTAPSSAQTQLSRASASKWPTAMAAAEPQAPPTSYLEQRRASAPGLSEKPGSKAPAPSAGDAVHTPSLPLTKLTFRVHADYLTTQSSLFRRILADTTPASAPGSPARGDDAGPGRPRLSRSHDGLAPVVLLPLPDPVAFSAILHYLYFGDFDALAAAMDSGGVRWEGVVSTAETIGCDQELKRKLGRYWRARMALSSPATGSPRVLASSPRSRSLHVPETPSREGLVPSWLAHKAQSATLSRSASLAAEGSKRRRQDTDDEDAVMSEAASMHDVGPPLPPHAHKARRMSRDETGVAGALERVQIETAATSPPAAVPSFVSGLMRRREGQRTLTEAGRRRSNTWTASAGGPPRRARSAQPPPS
ncbi:hypothetical protein FA09DRAFT_336066 [Tilletiopsis washingtonensis]|uniref:BTB domain-containing protein n=1 Tax=Tilletiopsis washingtonensis TaxID=58919 RepID=A0A316ZI02_9BASI|nr:hypothetical protein FA09DRAFT_336066 [Tilletiopsis washingtonensis]PWO00655.1 hypothetical protein FA09DRAFT_336066 [Tilletiopsis washingtonensis]